MRVASVLAMLCGAAFGLALAAPLLMRYSPVMVLAGVIVAIVVLSYFSVRREERITNERFLRKWFPPDRKD